MPQDPAPQKPTTRTRWTGAAGFIALGIFLLGRFALEPTRGLPHFDSNTMESYAAVETFELKRKPGPVDTVVLGSSVSIWGIIPELVAEELHQDPSRIRKLTIQGGTAFDMWNMIERNEPRFTGLKLALIEIGPRLFDVDKEGGRMDLSISQHATWAERALIDDKGERNVQLAEFALPLISARRPLSTVFLDIIHPDPDGFIFPDVDERIHPSGPWREKPDRVFKAKNTAADAARILFKDWGFSRLHDDSFRKLLAWLRERKIKTVLYETPCHPDLIKEINSNAEAMVGKTTYLRYIASLGVPPEDIILTDSVLDLGIPVEGMKDHTHLNEAGAKIFSRWLGQEARKRLDGSAK